MALKDTSPDINSVVIHVGTVAQQDERRQASTAKFGKQFQQITEQETYRLYQTLTPNTCSNVALMEMPMAGKQPPNLCIAVPTLVLLPS